MEIDNESKEFFEMFPTVKEFTLNNEEMAKKQGYVEDYMGRQRHLPDAQLPELTIKAYKKIPVDNVFFDNINSFIEDIDDETTAQWINKWLTLNTKSFNAKTKFKELAKANGVVVKDNGAFISKALTQCTNARIQGSAATLTKKAMIEISNDKRLQEIGIPSTIVRNTDETLERKELINRIMNEIPIGIERWNCLRNLMYDELKKINSKTPFWNTIPKRGL